MPVKLQTEAEFQQLIIDAAHYLGWRVAHFRGVRVQRKDGTVFYQTPVQADGEGFPDLVLVNPTQQRVIYAEVKSEMGRLSAAQIAWKVILEAAGQDYRLWQPKDWDEIEKTLRGN
jgi:hypothetical protein